MIKYYDIALMQTKINYYQAMRDHPEGKFAPGAIACVGAGNGGRFASTKELHVMKYDQAMVGPETKDWENAVKDEHD
jgi:hypothetical protein